MGCPVPLTSRVCVLGGQGGRGALCDGCCLVLAPEEKIPEAGSRSGDGRSRLLFLGLVLALVVSLVLVALVTFLISKYPPLHCWRARPCTSFVAGGFICSAKAQSEPRGRRFTNTAAKPLYSLWFLPGGPAVRGWAVDSGSFQVF